ncbi:MAG: hypothetical protein AAFO82_24605 [Bacteroidota bacterium]
MNLTYSQIRESISLCRLELVKQLRAPAYVALMLTCTIILLAGFSANTSPTIDLLETELEVADVTGTVTDAAGEPLIGVSILVKN